MCLSDAFAAFPNAKIVGAELSQEKLKFSGAIEKYDYLSTDPNALEKANELLKDEGIELINVDGDVVAHAIFCIVDNETILGTIHELRENLVICFKAEFHFLICIFHL